MIERIVLSIFGYGHLALYLYLLHCTNNLSCRLKIILFFSSKNLELILMKFGKDVEIDEEQEFLHIHCSVSLIKYAKQSKKC